MALSKTNVSKNSFSLGGATTATLSHNHPTGSNWIYVIVAIDSYTSISGVTYNGASMTSHSTHTAYYGGVWKVYKLDATSHTGTHNVVVSGLQSYDYVSVVAYSFSGADGIGNVTFDNTPATGTNDKTASITVSANSMIIGNGWNGASSPGTYWVEVPDGTAITNDYANQMYTFTWGGCSPSKSAGTYGCAVNQNITYAAIILLIEIKEGVTTTAPTVTTTSITSITSTTASGGGNVTSDGGASVTARGVCWSTSSNPTTANSKTTDGTGTGSFTSNITGLSAGTLYYVRAYATNSVGTSYGSQVSFTTLALATVTTDSPITNITSTTASGGGNVTADGGATVTARGVCWNTTGTPTTSDSSDVAPLGGTGTFTSSIIGLSANTTYHVRAFAVNSVGTAYGNEVDFTTGSATKRRVIIVG